MASRVRPKAGHPERPSRKAERAPARKSPAPIEAKVPSPAPPPAAAGPPPEAMHAFEAAMEALQRHRYADAATRFRQLVDRFPGERGLLDRARAYADLADREQRRKPAEPQTVEERLTAATAALNNGDDKQAESLARSVLARDPEQDLALYLVAAVEARRGKLDAALSYLGQAVAISPEVRAQAKHDADFEALRGLDAFRELTDPAPSSGAPPILGGTRRPRRPLR